MHAADRQTHYDGAGRRQGEASRRLEGDEQRRGREHHRQRHGKADQEGVVADLGVHPHRRHADIVHDDDPGPHDEAAHQQGRHRVGIDDDQPQPGAGQDDRQDEGQERPPEIIGDVHRHPHRQHTDEVHRPDASAGRHRGTRQPYRPHRARRSACPQADVVGDERTDDGKGDRDRDDLRNGIRSSGLMDPINDA